MLEVLGQQRAVLTGLEGQEMAGYMLEGLPRDFLLGARDQYCQSSSGTARDCAMCDSRKMQDKLKLQPLLLKGEPRAAYTLVKDTALCFMLGKESQRKTNTV